MRDTNLSTMNSSFPAQPEEGVRRLILGTQASSLQACGTPHAGSVRTQASMITAMLLGIMLISATAVKAQLVKSDALTRLSQRSTGNNVTRSPARPNQRAEPRAAASLIKEAALDGPPKKKAIVGTWLETVTFSGEGAPPPLKSLGTFTEDGSIVVADQGNDTTVLPFVFSPGHGTWVHLEGRTFAWTVIELITDLNGNLIATLKVRGQYTVNESGNEYTGQFKAELFDPFGNLFDSSEGTNEGHRVQVEPLQ